MGEAGGFTYEGLSSAPRIGLVLRVYRRCRLGGCDPGLRREYWRRHCLGATCVCRCFFSSLLHRTRLPGRKAGRQSCINRDRVPHASRFSHWHSHRNLPSGKYVAAVDSRANRRVVDNTASAVTSTVEAKKYYAAGEMNRVISWLLQAQRAFGIGAVLRLGLEQYCREVLEAIKRDV